MQFSLLDHPPWCCPLVVCSYGRRAEVVKLRDLEGLELAVFPSLYPWCLEKWFRLTDLADGSPPRTLSVIGDDNPRERVCEWWEWYCKTVTGPQLYLTAWPSGLDINTLSRVSFETPSRSTLDSVMLMLMPDCVASSVLSSPGHILLIGFFGDFFWGRNPVLKDVCH